MSRSYAQFSTSIWRDDDFLSLPSALQRVYMLLSSQQDITAAGVLPLAVNRWARKAPDTTPRDIVVALDGLVQRRFVVYDRETEEVFVRSFVRWDNGYKNPKRLHAIRDAADQIESPAIVNALATEFERLAVAEAFRGQCRGRSEVDAREPPYSNDDRPSSQVDGQSMGNTENGEGPSISRRRVPQPTTHNPQPVPPPADSADAPSEQATFEGMPALPAVAETEEQAGWRLARAWEKRRREARKPIIARGSKTKPDQVLMPLKNLIRGALIAEYTEDEVIAALEAINEGIPTGAKFDKVIADFRDRRPAFPYNTPHVGASPAFTAPAARRSTSAVRAEQALSVADELDRQHGHGRYAQEGIS